jgi:hypothetical protein
MFGVDNLPNGIYQMKDVGLLVRIDNRKAREVWRRERQDYLHLRG